MNNKGNLHLRFVLITLIILSFSSCHETLISPTCEDSIPVEFEHSDLCAPKIMSYHFGVEHLPISSQISTLTGLQMDGIILQIETNSLQNLDEYYEQCDVKSGEFNIYDIFTSISLDNPEELEIQMTTIEEIYKKIQNQTTVLQVIFNGVKGNDNTTTVISKIADIAEKYDKSVIIYPHEGNAIETAEEALNYINAIEKDNVFLSVHLCHELAAGNGDRMEEVVSNVVPYIKSVSISGATLGEQSDNTLPLWYWGIKPLEQGTYDYSTFYRTLYNIDYQGPIAIHTWGIFNNFDLAPENHLPKSREILLELATDVCE